MAVTVKQEVAALYSAIFNRAPDQAGLEFWVEAINGGDSLTKAAEGFTQHPVFAEVYGDLSNQAKVETLYTNVLGSAGDAAGIQFWVAKLESGVSFGQVVAEFVSGALTIDLDALLASGELSETDYAAAVVRQNSITNKADAGVYFADTFGAASNLSASTDATTKEGLESDPVYLASQAAIAGVTNDAATLAAAKAAIDAAEVPTDLNVVPAPVFTLAEALAAETLPEGYVLSDATADLGALAIADVAAAQAAAAAVVAGAANAAELELAATYTIADTLANVLAADAAVLADAASYSLTDAAGALGELTEAQIAVVQGAANVADYTYTVELTLTAGLEALQAAQAAEAAALKAIAEADLTDATKADGENVTVDNSATPAVNELQVAVDAYTADDAEAEVTAAAQAVADAEAGVLTAEAALTSARALKFTDGKVLTLEGVTANTYMTDANVAAAVTEAQANVNAAKSLYLEDGTIVANETGVAQAGYQKIYLANNALTTDANAAGAVFKGYVASATNVVAATTDETNAAGANGQDTTTAGTAAEVLVEVAADYSGTLTIGGTDYSVANGVVAGLDTYNSGDVAGVESIAQSGTTVTITGTLTDPDKDGTAEVATDLSNLVVTQTQPQTIFAAEDIAETVTAAQLQALAAAAEADLAADIANNGSYTDLLTDLRAAINAYVAAEGAADQTSSGDVLVGANSIRASVVAILEATSKTAEEVEAAAKEYVLEFVDGSVNAITSNAAADSIALAGQTATAEEKAVNDALAAFWTRDDLEDAAVLAENAFEGTGTGSVLAAAEALQEVRNGDIEAIATAQETLADAQAYNESLTALVEAYAAAGDAVTVAEEALADLGVENLVNLTEATSNGTLFGADLFVYAAGTNDATVARFEANDQLYIGKDFTFVTLSADDVLASARLGDAATLEVFVKQNGADVDFYIETEAFAGNQLNTIDFEVVTLTGVTVEDLSVSGGFITVA